MIAAALVALGTLAIGAAAGSAGSDGPFRVTHHSVAPDDAYFGGRKPATLRYVFRSAGERRRIGIEVVRVRTRQVVARWKRPAGAPGTPHAQRWHGSRRSGAPAPDGEYAFRITSPGEPPFPAGRFDLHGHRFPVDAGHGTRGPIGDFGAPRAGGRIHEGFDVTAPCGTPLLAVRAGRVERAGYDPELYGHFIEVDARHSALDYFYAHMTGPARASRGASVKTSERLGKIGLTGNAAGTPCHLHIEIRRGGRLVDPEPILRRWDRYS